MKDDESSDPVGKNQNKVTVGIRVSTKRTQSSKKSPPWRIEGAERCAVSSTEASWAMDELRGRRAEAPGQSPY